MLKIYSNFIPQNELEEAVNIPELINKPISVFNDYPNVTPDQLEFNPFNILMVLEPNQLFGIHDWAIQNHNLFSCILTGGQEILDKCPNALFFPMGITWLDKEYVNNVDNIQKQFEVSFLCGGKQRIEGHHLRHRLHKREDEITIPKQWHYTLPDYDYNDGHHTVTDMYGKKVLWESMFTIAIENSSNRGYHTEKIIDAFISKTFPIYWGCPNLEELGYNPDGFVYCENENQIIEVVNKLTPEFYTERKEAIDYNSELAKYYGDLFSRFKTIIETLVEFNNIEDKVLNTNQLFKKYKDNHNILFETGTHHGDGVNNALKAGFNKVISVEILPELHEECVNRFSEEIKENKVHLFLGDSNEKIKEMLELINEPAFFFLDGHFNNGEPLWKELEEIKNHSIKTHTIVVDDIPNYFGNGEKVKEKILEINSNYVFTHEDSYNSGTGKIHRNHQLISQIN